MTFELSLLHDLSASGYGKHKIQSKGEARNYQGDPASGLSQVVKHVVKAGGGVLPSEQKGRVKSNGAITFIDEILK